MLQDYKEQKKKILGEYKRILELPNILSIDITREEIKEKKRQLEEEHFFVSFTGQIKAGKSTLINALIFGQEIIPADDTPHTAKITVIKYGAKPKIEVLFYNKKEWELLQSNQNFYNEFLKSDIENSINNGVFAEELIYTTAKIKIDNNLDNLKEYVAKDGKYTPFVNTVALYYPNEILKDITIVDTPGTNDPNRLRDKITKEWIHKTNANIYITYANQAMDKVDTDFIDTFLLTVPKEQKLTVVNKIDSVNGTDGLEEYIDELLNNESLQRREIVSTRESLVLVSGLGGLIDKMLQNGLPLSEDLEYYADRLEEMGFLEPTNHKLPLLEKMIEKQLIENKGKNIINSHAKFLEAIFTKKIQELEQKLKSLRDSLSNLFKSKLELQDRKKKINEMIHFISKEKKKIDKKFIHLINKSMDDFFALGIKQNRVTIRDIREEIESIKNISNYKNEVLWIVKQSLDDNFNRLREDLRGITDNLSKNIQNEMDILKINLTKIDKNISIDITSVTFSIYSLKLTSGIRELAKSQFKKKSINKIVQGNSNIWQQIFNTKGALVKINSKIMSDIQLFFEQSSITMQNEFEKMLSKYIHENILDEIMSELNTIMSYKRDEVEEYIKIEQNKDSLIRNKKAEITALEKELEILLLTKRNRGIK